MLELDKFNIVSNSIAPLSKYLGSIGYTTVSQRIEFNKVKKKNFLKFKFEGRKNREIIVTYHQGNDTDSFLKDDLHVVIIRKPYESPKDFISFDLLLKKMNIDRNNHVLTKDDLKSVIDYRINGIIDSLSKIQEILIANKWDETVFPDWR